MARKKQTKKTEPIKIEETKETKETKETPIESIQTSTEIVEEITSPVKEEVIEIEKKTPKTYKPKVERSAMRPFIK
jgi:hypothetical protein